MPLAWPSPRTDSDDLRKGRASLYALGALAAGFALARYALSLHSAEWFGLAAIGLLISLAARGTACRIALMGVIAAAGAGWFALRIHEHPADSAAALIDPDPLAEAVTVRVEGLVVTPPRATFTDPAQAWITAPPPRGTTLELSLRAVLGDDAVRKARGRVRVYIEAPLAAITHRAGDFITITGRLRSVAGPLNPGDPPRDLIAAQDGLVGVLHAPSAELIGPSRASSTPDRVIAWWVRARATLHSAVEDTVTSAGTDPESGGAGRSLVRAMLLGQRDPALAEVESAFRRVGLLHLVAISGFNMAVLAFITLLAVRLTGDRGRLEAVLGAGVVLGYMLILPGEASIQRAGVMLLVFMAAEAAGRRYDRITLLGWVAFALLLARPMDLWSMGFQLSFGVVAALLGLGTRVHERLWGVEIRGLVRTPRQRRWWYLTGSALLRWTKAQATASLLAWAVAAPIIIHHTGLFSLISPVASLVMLPVIVVLTGLGYAAILIGLVAPAARETAAALLARLGDFSVWMVRHIDELPAATVDLPPLGVPWTILAMGAVVCWLGWGRLADLRAWALTLAPAAWAGAVFLIGPRLPASTLLRVDALSMGEGSCVLIRSGREAALFDCGASGVRPDAEDLRRSLRALGCWRVPTVVITDPRPLAWSKLPGLLELRPSIGIRTVLLPTALADAAEMDATRPPARLVRVVRDASLHARVVEPGDTFSIGPAVVTMAGRDGGSPLAARIRVDTGAGQRAVLLAMGATHPQLDDLAGDPRHADVIVLPRTMRAGDRPAAAVRALGAGLVVHAGSAVHAREVLGRLIGSGAAARVTARGAVGVEIRHDGSVRWAD